MLFDVIARNKRTSWLLLAGMSALLALLGAAAGFYLTGMLPVAAACAGGLLAIVLAVTSQADRITLSACGAHRVSREQLPVVYDLVEALCLAADLPMPTVHLVEDRAPNAFAVGLRPDRGSVAVTTGLLALLTRDELEAVLAHELAHIRNLDSRVAAYAVTSAGAINVVSDLLLRLTWVTGGRRNGSSNPLAIVALLAAAVLAPLGAALLRAAISRSRESLADACAVEMTRNPIALRSALEQLAADHTVVRASRTTAHVWFESPLHHDEQAPFAKLFSTHPPLSERIAALGEIAGASGAGTLSRAGQGIGLPLSLRPPSGAGPAHEVEPAAAHAWAAGASEGWYPDPVGEGLRFYDGRGWTGLTEPDGGPTVPHRPPPDPATRVER